MNGTSSRRDWALPALVVVTLGSLAVKLHGAFELPLAGDELFERAGARASTWLDFLFWNHAFSFFDTPPLSFALYRLLVVAPGLDSELAWRLPGIIAATACAPLVYKIARRLFSPGPSLLAAAACAFDLNLTWNAQIARPYPLFLMFLIGGLALASVDHRPGRLLGGFLLFTAALWTHLFAYVFIGGMVLGGAVAAVARQRPPWALPGRTLWCSAALALAGSLAYFVLFRFVADRRLPTEIPGAATHWPEALARIRWCIGLLTWIPIPFANPAIWVAAIGGLGWWARAKQHLLLPSVLAGGAAVLTSQFYTVWRHEFLEPRYLLGTALLLWLGAAAIGELLLPYRAGRLALIATAACAIPWQGLRAWNNENYYGTIAETRKAGRILSAVAQRLRTEHPGQSVHVVPGSVVLLGEVERHQLTALRASVSQRRSPTAGEIYLLAGRTTANRRHGNEVAAFVRDLAVATGIEPKVAHEIEQRCEAARWSLCVITSAGPRFEHFP